MYRSSSFLALRFANWVCTCTSVASRYLHAPYRRDGSSTTMTLTMEAAGAGGAEVIDLGLMLGVGWRRTCVRDALSQKCNSSCDRSIGAACHRKLAVCTMLEVLAGVAWYCCWVDSSNMHVHAQLATSDLFLIGSLTFSITKT